MNIAMNLVLALQILSALAMIGLVLIQHGKGADMGASFGSGASGSLFGATGSANFLSRSTAACAAVFFACTLALAYASNDKPKASTGSVLDSPANAALPASGTASARPASGAAQIPGSLAPQPRPASASAPAIAVPAAPKAPPGVSPVLPGAAAAASVPAK